MLAIGIPLTDVGASYFEIVPLERAERHAEQRAGVAARRRRHHDRAGRPPRRLGCPPRRAAAGRRRAGRARPSPAAASAPGSNRARTPTCRCSPARSTTWPSALQHRVERDARFASDVSHELRSPLTTLSASAEVLQSRRDELPEKAGAALDLIVADVGRFQNLVEDLLEISRFDAGAVRLHREDLLVAEFVRQAVGVSSLPEAHLTVDRRGRGARDPGRQAPAGPRGRQPARQRPLLRRRRGRRSTRRAGPARRRGRSPTCRSPSRTTAPACRPRSAARSSSASPAALAPAGGARARAPASAWPWSTSTCGCTAAGCGWRTARDGEEGARFVIELPGGAGVSRTRPGPLPAGRRRPAPCSGRPSSLGRCGLPTDSSPRDIPPEFVLDATPSSTVAPVVPSATSAPRPTS